MYTDRNFKTKKAFRDAVAKGDRVGIWQPGPFGGNEPKNGTVAIEGPHYVAHTWYATATVKDGVVVKVK